MTITTKFSIGDSVWVMKDGKPQTFVVGGVVTKTIPIPKRWNCGENSRTVIAYSDLCNQFNHNETRCYASKEELLASL